ncbi:sushi, von Willebrand factor type A, EGF and pentraxin domain-containing protein 1-like [Harmonia axyridis]|uniref:sushi, von Willebrand factor type A, EGF and pentraxin domain-containing protein 1-like n=1 Tax=Harmonia axyridis TaxID=115357 RepID=UPI001E27661C|nr:sushi, von Willebrand factor type A, EGF and pentraxin domain-containing protein 1-like [Harmonia axyridis]
MFKRYELISIILIAFLNSASLQKPEYGNIKNYSAFLNHGDKKSSFYKKSVLENEVVVTKVDILGEIFKKNIESLKKTKELDIIFLIDGSSSVGKDNFRSELKFVKKLLSDVTVDLNHTRVGIISFSSSDNVLKNVDEISIPRGENNKCLLLNKQLTAVNFVGGETFTLGAFQKSKEIFDNSRNSSKKVIFLITDGFSNGGDPVPVAEELKKQGITIFTIGIRNGNYEELYKLSSKPGEIHSYLLDSFEEFESLARRALHVDLKVGDYIPLGINSPCDNLCKGGDCCHKDAVCTCGTSTGHYSCVCPAGYYGSGLKEEGCSLCPVGFYSDGPNLCTPCPDIFHTTVPPAYGKGSCQCKTGYKTSNETDQCEAIMCKKLAEPKHGYFVKKSCDNVINSACGVRCEVGYNLAGTSIRLCQNNGSWTGQTPSCQVRMCDKLTIPQFGLMSCVHSDLGITFKNNQTTYPVDTVCSFKCEKGKIFIGSRHRTCLPLAKWNGLRAMCRPVKCKKLPSIANAKIEPPSCNYGKQANGKKCKITCNEGYETIGPKERICTGDLGAWNTKEETSCKDVTPPVIKCMKNITTRSNFGLNYGYAIWEAPMITDNSNDELVVWTKPPIANLSSFQFLIGQTEITYYAEDSSKNLAKCTTTVTVKDEERPMIENCINPSPFLSEDGKGANVTWDEPYIHDNSHHAIVTRSHSFGYFKLGTTTITYAAEDDSGNRNICQMNITVREAKCDEFEAPENGRSECSRKNNTITCVASCNEGFLLPLSSPYSKKTSMDSITFKCNVSENIWYNEDGLLLPECTKNIKPKEIFQNATTDLEPDFDCSKELEKNKEVENELRTIISKKLCKTNCTVTTNSQCLEGIFSESEEEITNIIKREINQKNRSNRGRSKKKKLRINIHIKSQYNNNTLVLTDLNVKNSTIHFSKPQFLCPPGYIPRKNRCVQCPKGTYQLENKCRNCGFGYYNADYGRTSCSQCPLHLSTRKMRSKSITECRKQCPPGTHARKKAIRNSKKLYKKVIERPTLQPFCKSCPIGTYQDDYGQIQCMPCPKGYTTLGYGSKDVGQCIETAEEICMKSRNICNHGTCISRDRIHYDCDCFKGYIGSHCEKRLEVCENNPCRNGGSCSVSYNSHNELEYKCLCLEGYSGSSCEQEIKICKLKCVNGGKCFEYDDDAFACECPEGFEGDLCEIATSFCQDGICENNSTCLEKPTSYQCSCPKGYIGKRCNILPCDYRPCPKNAICQNVDEIEATINSFRCVCSEGWTGKSCEVKIDFCSSNPCQNNGTCINSPSGFKCECPKLYHGMFCEELHDSNYVLVFERYKTTDYIRLPKFNKDLHEITICMWVKVTDTFNYGTLISYATIEDDNAFALTDYTGLIMYVNGKYIATDVLLNDGIWHHVCATWASLDGIYQVFIDGKLRQFGSGLSIGKSIKAHGSMIIGQEQDALGGKFSQSETFVGRMTLVDIWSRVLKKNDILKHFHDCKNGMYGDLYSWTDFQFFIQGNLKKEPSAFCNECPKPKKLISGFVEVRDRLAHYNCEEGYKIGNDYKGGRKCLKSSKWEGQREPYCRRVYCGPPGFLRNGFIHGTNYYFEDQVNCGCVDGYNLVGAKTLTCGKNGKWEPSKPSCIGPQCRAFKIPKNGNITVFAEMFHDIYEEEKTLFDVGTQIEVTCKEGTTLIGESVITCQESGVWDNDPPICESPFTTTQKPPRCSIDQLPSFPENGHIVEESIEAYQEELSNIVDYNCNIGFETDGVNSSICNDGVWSDVNISCTSEFPGVSCGYPGDLLDGYLIGNSYKFGDDVSFECNTGYSLKGLQSMICEEDGKWKGSIPSCVRISCPVPSRIDHGSIVGKSTFFGDTLNIICDKGFKLDGYSSLTCGKDGNWGPNFPKCTRITCGPPDNIENGLSFGRSYKFEDFVTFECNEGYYLEGAGTIRCDENGVWVPSQPKCKKITCGDPGHVNNGLAVGREFFYGNSVKYRCEKGYKLKGSEEIICGKNGNWTPSKPSCVGISCRNIIDFENGMILRNDKKSYRYGDKLYFECKEGFVLRGESSTTCNEFGQWTSIPTCLIIPTTTPATTTTTKMKNCGTPTKSDNMVLIENYGNHEFPPGSTVHFNCTVGHELIGNEMLKCLEDGSWSGLQGECKRISCNSPGILENGLVYGNSYYFEDKVVYECNPGHNLVGSTFSSCSEKGVWTPPKPDCVVISTTTTPTTTTSKVPKITCRDPKTPFNMIKTGNHHSSPHSPGSSIIFGCVEGYKMLGNNIMRCTRSGRWTRLQGKCRRISCRQPEVSKKTKIIGDSYLYEDIVTIICRNNAKYELKCNREGIWEGPRDDSC